MKELSSIGVGVIAKSTIALKTAKIMRAGIIRISTIAISMTFVMTPIPAIRCATYQLKSKKQNHYQEKKSLFNHSYPSLPSDLNLIIGFLGFKRKDLMKLNKGPLSEEMKESREDVSATRLDGPFEAYLVRHPPYSPRGAKC